MQDWKMTDNITLQGVENAGLEIDDKSVGVEFAGLEKDGQQCRGGKCKTGN